MADSSDAAAAAAPDLGFLETVQTDRASDRSRRARLGKSFSVVVTVVWLAGVTATGNWGRVIDNLVASVTMLFGSFVAGSTPQGGGAVAFPVFTKGLEIPSEVARTFSLCIQTFGMGAASFAILVNRRPISGRTLAVTIPTALVGFFVGLFALGDRDALFWPSTLPGPYVKVFFTLLVAAMAFVVFLGSRVPLREVRTRIEPFGPRQILIMATCGFCGGMASSLVGSGADVFLYIAVVVMLGVEPKIAVPTSVIAMAAVSVVGFVYLGLVEGQLDITLVGDQVTAVGGTVLPESLEASRFDLLGLWLAAVPVVCWAGPLGSAFASRVTSRQLALFVVALAAAEVLTTVIFLTELREDMALLAFAVFGGAGLVGVLYLAGRFRHTFAGVRLDLDQTITRNSLDVASDYKRGLGVDGDEPKGPPS